MDRLAVCKGYFDAVGAIDLVRGERAAKLDKVTRARQQGPAELPPRDAQHIPGCGDIQPAFDLAHLVHETHSVAIRLREAHGLVQQGPDIGEQLAAK